MTHPSLRARAVLAGIFLLSARLGAVELDPIPRGPLPVATTNLEVTAQADAKVMFDYMNGKVAQYLTDILVHPDAVPTVQVDVPDDKKLFGARAGTRVPFVLMVVYPTTADNPRVDYEYPYKDTGDALLTHMQQPGDKPLVSRAAEKRPLLLFCGGYNTHGLWHLGHMKDLASRGYIVVDIFNADGRDASFEGNLALRSLALRATLNFLLQRSDFASAIDPDRIGAIGESAGGHTVLAALGGIDPAGRLPASADPRIKAAFGQVPFTGNRFEFEGVKYDAWYFGEDRAGLRGVTRPFLALYAEKDANVTPDGVETAVRAMPGSAMAVMLDGEKHVISNAASEDVRTWEILFFDTWLRDDAMARQKLEAGTSVRGGVHDHKTISPAASAPR